jgi:hypothetical protein
LGEEPKVVAPPGQVETDVVEVTLRLDPLEGLEILHEPRAIAVGLQRAEHVGLRSLRFFTVDLAGWEIQALLSEELADERPSLVVMMTTGVGPLASARRRSITPG